MAYTKQQARAYYLNYTKKGKRKGRRKGSGIKKSSSSSKVFGKMMPTSTTTTTMAKPTNESALQMQSVSANEGARSSTTKKIARAKYTKESKEARERINAEKKEFMNQYREQVKAKIDSLREEMKMRLKGMPAGPEKDALKAEYQERIKAIQELKKQQTEQFNEYFKKYKEDTLNSLREKYGIEPKTPSPFETFAELSSGQKGVLDNALGGIGRM